MNIGNMAKGMNHTISAEPDETMETLDAAMEKVHQLQQQLAAAREALQAAEADAARYRWLQLRVRGIDGDSRFPQRFQFPTVDPVTNLMRGSMAGHLDAAIDATLQRDRQP